MGDHFDSSLLQYGVEDPKISILAPNALNLAGGFKEVVTDVDIVSTRKS